MRVLILTESASLSADLLRQTSKRIESAPRGMSRLEAAVRCNHCPSGKFWLRCGSIAGEALMFKSLCEIRTLMRSQNRHVMTIVGGASSDGLPEAGKSRQGLPIPSLQRLRFAYW